MKIIKILFLLIIISLIIGCASMVPYSIPKENCFYYEDFRSTQEGTLPQNWIGGSTLAVNSSNRLTPFKEADWKTGHQVTVDNIEFPDNFVFEFDIASYKTKTNIFNKGMNFSIGNLSLSISSRGVYFGESKLNTKHGIHKFYVIPEDNSGNVLYWDTNFQGAIYMRNMKIRIERKAQVFTLYIYGKKCKVIRKDDFSGSTFSINSFVDFSIRKIYGYDPGEVGTNE